MAVSRNMLKAEAGAISSAAPSGYRDMLLVHNIYRCLHDLPPLVWHDKLAKSAKKHIDDNCQSSACSGSSIGDSRTAEFALVGENIGSSTTLSWGQVVSRDWYETQIVHADGWSQEDTLPTKLASDVDTPDDLTLRPGEEQPSF